MKKNEIIIYRATVSKNNITYVYIGQTNRSLEERKKEHAQKAFSSNSSTSFHEAMKSITAFNDWKWEILYACDPSEANFQEKRFISIYSNEAYKNSSLIALNDSHNSNNTTIEKNPDFGIPKARKQKNYAPGEIGKKFARLSGKLQPVINLKTKKIYESTLAAERNDHVPRTTIKLSCSTGKKLSDGTQYAYLDLDDQPILKDGHHKEYYIAQKARKVKELTSGIIYNNSNEVAEKYGLSSTSVSSFASGKYLIAKNQYIFCYLDEKENELKTERHMLALERLSKQSKINYVAWPVELYYEIAKKQKQVAYFKSFDEVYKKLNIKNKSHIKAVCDGKRSHVESYRIAFFNHKTDSPVLTPAHELASKKIVRKVQCLDNGKIYNNCTEAGYAYSVEASQIGLCAKGILKSVRVRNEEKNQTERFRFAYLDKSGNPILKPKHKEPLGQRKGTARIVLINQNPEIIKYLGTDTFNSLAEFCRKTGVPHRRARKYLKDKKVNLLGYEFVLID